jgi:hypothetical protein
MKLIFIGSYVGENVSGSHRQERLIRKALDENLIVELIKPNGYFRGVYTFKTAESFDFWKFSNLIPNPKPSVNDSWYKKYLVHLKYLLLIDIFGYGFFRTILMLRSVLKSNPENRFVLVSSPVIASAVATYFYFKFSKTEFQYSVDMRDAWAYHPNILVLKRFRKFIESKILRNAKYVTTVSKYLKEEFENSHGIRVDLLYNVNLKLIDSDKNDHSFKIVEQDRFTIPTSCINVCYFGSIPNSFYNIDEFCKGLVDYLHINANKKMIKLFFFGPCGELKRASMRYPILNDVLEFHSYISYEKAISLMKSSDAVLFFGYNGEKNAGIVSTKIFEYFYLKCRMLLFDIKKDSDLDWLISKACDQSVFINTSAELTEYLLDVFVNIDMLPSCRNKTFLFELDADYNKFIKKLKSEVNE